MSIEAMVWALNDAPVADMSQLVVLLGLANHADRDGRYSWPAQKTLAGYGRCSIRTVRRKLADLEAAGIIRRGDQAAVAHFPADSRPVVWDLVFGQDDRPDTMAGGSSVTVPPRSSGHEGPVKGGRTDGPRVADKSSLEPSLKPSLEPSAEFAAWYSAYPRKAGKAAAAKAYAAARKTADAETLLEGARRYAADPGRAAQFTKYPATWLNAGCWEDDPLPAPAVQLDRGAVILAGELDAARAADLAREAGREWRRQLGGLV